MFDYVSDLHVSKGTIFNWEKHVKNKRNNTLIIAGDSASDFFKSGNIANDAGEFYKNVIAVDGNHEHDSGFDPMYQNKMFLKSNVIFLDGLIKYKHIIDDVLYVGYNGWYKLFDRQLDNVIKTISKAQTDEAINKIIVITHYPPFVPEKLILNEQISSLKSQCLPNLGNSIYRADYNCKILAFVFGHLHINVNESFDYFHLLSNPRGNSGYSRDDIEWVGIESFPKN